MIVRPYRRHPRQTPGRMRDGTAFEPRHRQLIDAELPGGRWETAAYNRERGSFWVRAGDRWMELDRDDVAFWRQRPPKPGRPFQGMEGLR